MTFASPHGRDSLSVFRERFGAPRALVGMLHLGAVPDTPSAAHSVDTLIQQALTEARIYQHRETLSVAAQGPGCVAVLTDRAHRWRSASGAD